MIKDGVFYRRPIYNERQEHLDLAQMCVDRGHEKVRHIARYCRGGRKQAELEEEVSRLCQLAGRYLFVVGQLDSRLGRFQ